MKIIIAPNAFKECLTATQAAQALETGIKRVSPRIAVKKIPLADGGDGTVEALIRACRGKIHWAQVHNPLGQVISAKYGILGDGETAVIEMAQASGLKLIPLKKRNPLLTTTLGTGELIRAALDKGCRRFIIGIGGSATNDGGLGMAKALGVQFFNKKGHEIEPTGQGLSQLHSINLHNLDSRVKESQFLVACDVTNPLVGKRGAAYVYAPQKGATQRMVQLLDQGLRNYARVIKRELNIDLKAVPGAGAAGGLGAGLLAFLRGQLKQGVELILDTVKFDKYIKDADLIITAEGKIDHQTLYGKVPAGVAGRAKKHRIPVIAIAGNVAVNRSALNQGGITAAFSLTPAPMSQQKAMGRAYPLLIQCVEEIVSLLISFYSCDKG